MCSCLDNYEEDISFCANDGSQDSPTIRLDAPKVFFGSGALSLLAVQPQKLKFTGRNIANKATIQIMVGRTAEESPQEP